MSTALPNSPEFRWRILSLYYGIVLPGPAVLVASLFALLDLTGVAWVWLCSFAGGYAVLVSTIATKKQLSTIDPITTFLDHGSEDRLADEDCLAGFSATMDLPRSLAMVAMAAWSATAGLTAGSMALRFGSFGSTESAIVVIAGLIAGFVAGGILFCAVKREVEEIRVTLAAKIPNPEIRRAQLRPISLRSKIICGAVGMAAVPMIVALVFFSVKMSAGIQDFTMRWQNGVLDELADRLDEQELSAATASVLGDKSSLAAPLDVTLLDFSAPKAGERGRLDAQLVAEIRAERESGVERGSRGSRLFGCVFSWRVLEDSSVLVVSTPLRALEFETSRTWIAFAGLLAVAIVIGGVLAWLISSDIIRSLGQLSTEVTRMASGDLRRGRVFDSEDEIGELSRCLESMAESLRSALSRVFGAVDQLEETAAGIASISEGVAAVTADQVSGIQQAALSTEAIDTQVRGIAESSGVLNSSVEESSSSILELGAAGDDLNQTAVTLSEKVDEVSTSMEQIVRSVSQVVESTEALSAASSETSSSMELMANSLMEVDEIAEESARLSNYVVSTAESGQEKVRQTIEGMDAIRLATETAEKVIRNLGGRTTEIGAIVDVIDDVADETNLLALNAAIIAAQAGEHGRAFSVVADEIKDLAERVLASTKEIGDLIRAVQEEGENAIGAIETGTESVASGVDLSAEAGISLEEITRVSRDSGERIQGILKAVRAQARAASHVVELMEKVRGGVDEIRRAATEQERGNTVVYRSTTAMRDVAQQVRTTTEEQSRGSGRIRESVEGQREAVEQINQALQEQAAACRSAVEFIEEIFAQTRANEESARRMDQASKGLLKQSAGLREDVHRFRL
jgi:methyl-accepting chemotaxis protein